LASLAKWYNSSGKKGKQRIDAPPARCRSASHPGFRFLTREDLTNRKVGTKSARYATDGSISEVTLTDGTWTVARPGIAR
jgi:hypothetical protein